MIPAIAYLAAATSFGLSAASTAWDIYQKYERMRENERYWQDYYENTGISPLYPYRSGSYSDYVGTALEVSQGVLNLYRRRY